MIVSEAHFVQSCICDCGVTPCACKWYFYDEVSVPTRDLSLEEALKFIEGTKNPLEYEVEND